MLFHVSTLGLKMPPIVTGSSVILQALDRKLVRKLLKTIKAFASLSRVNVTLAWERVQKTWAIMLGFSYFKFFLWDIMLVFVNYYKMSNAPDSFITFLYKS